MKHRVFECKEYSYSTRKHKGLWKYFHNLITTNLINYGAQTSNNSYSSMTKIDPITSKFNKVLRTKFLNCFHVAQTFSSIDVQLSPLLQCQ